MTTTQPRETVPLSRQEEVFSNLEEQTKYADAFAANPQALHSHLQALESLHTYDGGKVISRQSMGLSSATPYGSFYEEKVIFSDGAVRTLTRGVPNKKWFGDRVSTFPISGTDALGTGPTGLNAILVDQYVQLGIPVEWLHHQGRHTEIPRTTRGVVDLAQYIMKKSVGRSAHHQHGMLDDVAATADYDASKILSVGDSRGAMIGEAVDALAHMYGRTVLWSDYMARCFEHQPTLREFPAIVLELITMPRAIVRLARRMRSYEDDGRKIKPLDLVGTIDLHPMNLVHEIAWTKALMSGDTGRYADAVQLDRHGARTHMSGDRWSPGNTWEDKHTIRPGIKYFPKSLPNGDPATHIDLADPVIQKERTDRLARFVEQTQLKHMLPELVDYTYVAHGSSEAERAA